MLRETGKSIKKPTNYIQVNSGAGFETFKGLIEDEIER